MASRFAQCTIGASAGEKRQSAHVDEKELEGALNDPHAMGTFARLSQAHEEAMSATRPYDAMWEKALVYLETLTGAPVAGAATYLRNPVGLLGEDVVAAVEAIGQDHFARFGSKNEKAWRANHQPLMEALKAQVMQRFEGTPYADYAESYFNYYIRGGEWYAGNKRNPFDKMARTAAGKITPYNPVIAAMNIFEAVPKGLVYAIESGNPALAFKALSSVLQKTGGNPFKRIADYERMGIYTDRPVGLKRFDPVDHTETFLRSYASELGALSGRGVTNGLENVSFISRFGNVPRGLWNSENTGVLTLMRFAVASNKMYLNMMGNVVHGLRTGDMQKAGQNALALAAFSAMTAIQTGGQSAIPAPVAFVLKKTDPEAYEALKELDQQAPFLNLSRNLGIDVAEKMQPLGGFALGVGQSIATQDIAGGLKNLGKVPSDVKDGEFGLALARMTEGFLGLGQVTNKIPGINITSKRFVASIVEQMEKDGEFEAQNSLLEFVKKSGINPNVTE